MKKAGSSEVVLEAQERSKIVSGKSSETRDIPSERPGSVIQRLEKLHGSPETNN